MIENMTIKTASCRKLGFASDGIFDTHTNKLVVSVQNDGYWNAAQMCQLYEKPFATFFLRQRTQGLISALETQKSQLAIELPSTGIPESYVYFLLDIEAMVVKVGYSSQIDERLKQIRSHTISPLVLVKIIPGGFKEEQLIHQRFSHLRVHHEWFRFNKELNVFVDECASEPPIWIHGCIAANLAGWLDTEFQVLVYDYIFGYRVQLRKRQETLEVFTIQNATLEHQYNQALYRMDSAGLLQPMTDDDESYLCDWEADVNGEEE
jgi:hypothetical protein